MQDFGTRCPCTDTWSLQAKARARSIAAAGASVVFQGHVAWQDMGKSAPGGRLSLGAVLALRHAR